MTIRKWISDAQANGWIVQGVRHDKIKLVCSAHGCLSEHTASLDDPGPIPARCEKPHKMGYARATYDAYEDMVGELRRRRRLLGLDQGDLNAAMGMTDGYINKLEALHRTCAPPTMLLWAETLGLRFTTVPATLPPATLRAIEQRASKPYAHAQARYKHDKA